MEVYVASELYPLLIKMTSSNIQLFKFSTPQGLRRMSASDAEKKSLRSVMEACEHWKEKYDQCWNNWSAASTVIVYLLLVALFANIVWRFYRDLPSSRIATIGFFEKLQL